MNRLKNNIGKQFHLQLPLKIINYLRINLTKEVKDLYNENYKPLEERNQKRIQKMERTPCSWIGRINIVKMAILPKVIYIFSAIPINSSQRLKNQHFQVHLEAQKTWNSQGQGNMNKKEQHWR
jgi:hypothetical protein